MHKGILRASTGAICDAAADWLPGGALPMPEVALRQRFLTQLCQIPLRSGNCGDVGALNGRLSSHSAQRDCDLLKLLLPGKRYWPVDGQAADRGGNARALFQ
jgi:hypothetical protein